MPLKSCNFVSLHLLVPTVLAVQTYSPNHE